MSKIFKEKKGKRKLVDIGSVRPNFGWRENDFLIDYGQMRERDKFVNYFKVLEIFVKDNGGLAAREKRGSKKGRKELLGSG